MAVDKNKTVQVLKGNVVPIKLGIVGVINRSQEDIEANKSIEEALEFEREFLEDNYPSIAPYHGIPFLAQKLNAILRKHIASVCPDIIEKLRNMSLVTETELLALGADGDLSDCEKIGIIVSIIDRFCNDYKGQIDGQSRLDLTPPSLTTGARINLILSERLNAELNLLEPFSNVSDDEILTAIRNALPIGRRMISPEVALDYFIKEEIKKLLPLALHIAQYTFQEMVDTIGKCLRNSGRFPKINIAIFTAVTEILKQKFDCTKNILRTYFEVQSSSAWTSNSTYNTIFRESMSSVCTVDLGNLPTSHICNKNGDRLCSLSNGTKCSDSGAAQFSPAQLELCKQVRNLTAKVFEIVRGQSQDFIAKAILSSLIYKTIDTISIILHTKLTNPENVDALVREPEDIQYRRICLRQQLQGYSEALCLLETLVSETM